jgi:hypothetical protein
LVTARIDDVDNHERNRIRLIENRFNESLYERVSNTSRCAIKFSKAIKNKRYEQFERLFSAYLESIVSLMAMANFYPNYIDPDDKYILNWLAKFDDETSIALQSQPTVCPFLKLVEFGRLKVHSGLWDRLEFSNRRMFLCNIDVIDFFGVENLVDRYLPSDNSNSSASKKELISGITNEKTRKSRIISLREKVLLEHPSDLAQLFFTFVDSEEIRHYWQARFLFDVSRLVLLIGLPLSNTPLSEITKSLKEI